MTRAQFIWEYVVPAASRLPERVLRFLHRHAPIMVDPMDGWSLWTEASYLRYCRSKGAA